MIVTVSAILVLLLFSLAGAAALRMHGGGGRDFGKWFDRIFMMSLFVIALAPIAGWYSIIAYTGVLGIATGHGQYFPALVAKYLPPKNVEALDFIVSWFFGDDPRTDKVLAGRYENSPVISTLMAGYGLKRLSNRCRFGLFVTGTLAGLPAACIAFKFGASFAALMFLSTGILKALAYGIGWEWKSSTEYGEALTGATWGQICGLIFVMGVWG